MQEGDGGMTHRLSAASIELLRIMDTRQDERRKWFKKPDRVRLEVLARRGYIESGVSVRFGWLTEKGKAALE